jgi:hypothetical protein
MEPCLGGQVCNCHKSASSYNIIILLTGPPAFQYQTEGADYLLGLAKNEKYCGGILAYDMGLEKTGNQLFIYT